MRILGLLLVAAIAALGMLAAGCVSRSGGQLGHASFAYEECAFGCTVPDNPMAAGGAHAVINVTVDSGYTFSQVRSSNPGVADFSLASVTFGGGIGVDVVSGTPGSADLELFDSHGKLVDQVTVTVAATAKLAYTQGWTGAAPLVLAGSTQYFHVTTQGTNGKTLIGTGAVQFDLAGPLHATGLYLGGDGQGFAGDPGAGSVTAHAGSVAATLPVTVVPPDAVTTLTPAVKPNSVEGQSTYANVDVVASGASGAIYGAACAWTVPAGVTLSSQSPASLESPARTSTRFLLSTPGTFTATCSVGAVSTSVTLTR